MDTPTPLRNAANQSKAWPFTEARRLLHRIDKHPKNSTTPIVFQTGYGPSGLPHIGTFGEVLRTNMIRRALTTLSDHPTRLICFSDDMDGLRKVPTNIPNADTLINDLHKPLCRVRDPFGTHSSFAAHNNAQLCSFLDSFGFDYEFIAASDAYQNGLFDHVLLTALERFDALMDIVLPTLRSERRATYSPFLPISPHTGHVLQTPTLERNVAKGTIVYAEANGEKIEIPVTKGHVKMQWKADWALRWVALGVDYEMSGKDLIDSVRISSRLCRALGGIPPESLSYELFNDEQGQKISKSKGNGLTLEQWLRYAPQDSLAYFMYQKPKTAKRLSFDVIPRSTDEYHRSIAAYHRQSLSEQLANPVFHIHADAHTAKGVPHSDMVVSYSMLINLVAAAGAANRDVLWQFISRYAVGVSAATHPMLDRMVDYAVRYYSDFVACTHKYRAPNAHESAALFDLAGRLHMRVRNGQKDNNAQETIDSLQTLVFDVGKAHGFDPISKWFHVLYQVVLGMAEGPRFGGLIAIYGAQNMAVLLEQAAQGALAHSAKR